MHGKRTPRVPTPVLSSAFIRVHLRFLFLLSVCLGTSSMSLAATGPDGNTLPDESAAPLEPAQIAGLHDHHAGHDHGPMTRQQHQEFAAAVDLSAFRKLAVFDAGIVKIVDTLARDRVNAIYGKPKWRDFTWDTVDLEPKQRKKRNYDPVFTYLDLTFNRPYYADKPILHVEVLPFREKLLAHLPPEEQESWKILGRLSWEVFASPEAQAVFQAPDSSRTEMAGRDQLYGSATAFINTGARLNLVSPKPGHVEWSHIDPHVGLEAGDASTDSPPAAVRPADIGDLWLNLGEAWRHGDAEGVNQILAALVTELPRVNPETYPPAYRLELESIYNATGKFTIGYVLYAIATLALILALGTGRKTLLALGVSLLLLGLLAHAAGFTIRAILSGRWAIHNQFESYIAISLFAVIVGVVFMFAKRMWVFGAAAAALGTVSLFAANVKDIPSHEVGQVAGILATSKILYVHVNMVLVSYSLIALSFFVSLAYLFAHYVKSKEATAFAAASVGDLETAAAPGSEENHFRGRKKLLADLDRAQLTLMQLAFWLLGVGIMLGAYWADHSWGRWWAWDPKETWALITWIVYLIVIHVRFGVRDRGLVTAWLSVAGFVVMLWTYKGVNLLLPGLHAYA